MTATRDTDNWTRAAEERLLEEALRLAPIDGWTERTVRLAGRAGGVSGGRTAAPLPRGPPDLAALLSRRHDQRALLMLKDVDPQSLKIRERIARAVEARIDAVG